MRVNDHYLAITALGNDSIGVLEAFTKVAKQCTANLLEAKLKKMGNECALSLYFTGSWNAIAKLEALLPQLAKQYEFILQSKRTQPTTQPPALPYQVQVIAQDRSGSSTTSLSFLNKIKLVLNKWKLKRTLLKTKR